MRPPQLLPTRYRWREWRDEERSFSNSASPLPPFFRWRTTPGFRSIPGLPAPIWQLRDQTIAAPHNPPACAGRLTTASFRGRRRHSCIEPGLKFATTGGDRTREVSQFQAKHRHHFAIVKLIQVIEGESAALWFRCSRNPNRQLSRFELLDLFRRPWRKFG